MEIERKYRIRHLPENLEQYPRRQIEQGYLCSSPVVRIRRSNEEFWLTYKGPAVERIGLEQNGSFKKSEGLGATRVCTEVEVPLTEEAYVHLREKTDDFLIHKIRYLLPLDNGLTAELDVFGGRLWGLVFVEVEFESEADAEAFLPPDWFGENVSADRRYSNSSLAGLSELPDF